MIIYMAFLNLFPSSYVLFFSPGDLINVGCFLSLTWKESPSFAKWYGSNFGLFPLKLSKIWKLRQMVYRNFPEEFPEIRISEMRTIQPKILEIPGAKLKEGKLLGKSYRKFGCNSRGCPLFENFGKCCPFATGSCRKFKPDDSALYVGLKLILPQLPTLLAPAMALIFLFGGAKEPIIWASGSTERV